MNTAEVLKVAIVEDDMVTRDCLREALEDEGFDIVAVASTADEACTKGFGVTADVIMVDLALGEDSGVDVIRELRGRIPAVEIMAHTMFDDRDVVFRALEAGATSYLLKGSTTTELTTALREVRAGGAPMSPKIARLVIKKLQATSEPDPLTPRERQILRAIDEGLTYKEIAAKLAISAHTVHSHIKTTYERLHASGKREALAVARQRGLI
jgi:DNA-binding NarL/FixJ family response regulator